MILILKLANKKIYLKKQDFFFLFTILKEISIILNISKLKLFIF